ncbi:MAG: hypothetical protein QW795_06590, partial [Candidatus Bathyarchaeia archaeon]
NALAVKSLVLNGKFENEDDYEISVEFSGEELKMFANNFVVIYDDDERSYYVLLLDCRLRNEEIKEISDSSIREIEDAYEKLYKKLDIYYCYEMDMFLKGIVSFRNVEDELEKWFNDFAISNGRLPNIKEIKEFIIGYMKSFDLKSEIEEILRKAKLIGIK